MKREGRISPAQRQSLIPTVPSRAVLIRAVERDSVQQEAALMPLPTLWQEAASCARACLDDARERLDEDAYSVYVALLVTLAFKEADRLLAGEAYRAARGDEP